MTTFWTKKFLMNEWNENTYYRKRAKYFDNLLRKYCAMNISMQSVLQYQRRFSLEEMKDRIWLLTDRSQNLPK